MLFQDKLQQIDHLQEVIRNHGKLSDEVLKKINYKFRLEWNYNSNNMEGNSLTRRETRTVMVGNITVDGKPIQDVLEMKRHDDVITNILKMGKGELNISEKRIKEIHIGIMYEENPERREQIGQWKKNKNYLYNYKEERFDFVEPSEVADRMHKLVDWTNAQTEKIKRDARDALHPVLLAFKFHLDYITIHPFFDGNGRTSRILTNLILISYGYPPLYIKAEEKGIYYQYLADIQGYGGDPDLFYEFMAGLLIRSQEIVLNAIAGKDIEEPDDLIKEISLWKNQLGNDQFEARTNSRIVELYYNCIDSFFDLFRNKMRAAFYDLFAEWEELGLVNNTYQNNKGKEYIDEKFKIFANNTKRADEEAKKGVKYVSDVASIRFLFQIFMKGFTRDKTNTFSLPNEIGIEFQQFKYITEINQKKMPEKLYVEEISPEEQNEMINNAVKETFQQVKLQIKNPPLSDLLGS